MEMTDLHEMVRLHGLWLGDRSTGRKLDLRDADLRRADLQGAHLRAADFGGANLRGADLREANLLWANLQDANLQEANLLWADLRRADLQGADLTGATGLPPILPPEVGAFTGFKKCRGRKIVELLIPADAYRSSATGQECRSSKALVASIDGDATPGVVAYSIYDPDFLYEVGLVAACDCWEPDRWVECGGGIHFYLTRKEALDYK